MYLIIVGIILHVVFLMSVFDIYFKSPVVHGIVPQSNYFSAPAKRIVLFVADGLRAETFFSARYNGMSYASYLRQVMDTSGAWGVSHTRVPTESRPGHVALIAGLYEDPSAVAKGWKENPVEFDSVFNRSRYTWSWGSPDILPMFAKGATGDHVRMDMYGGELEDFSGRNETTVTDLWVFDTVQSFFHLAKSDVALTKELEEDKTVFFLHLLGLDTAGHTYKPHSQEWLKALIMKDEGNVFATLEQCWNETLLVSGGHWIPAREYLKNIMFVDKGVERIHNLVEEFFGDNKTAYIFTSDHGMTDWGSHGAGEPSETETPLIAWGAGIDGPRPPSGSKHSSPAEWQVGHLRRRDVRQADIAPLMATLIGVPIPVHSVGSLPLSYLNLPEAHLAEAIFTNARQITAQLDRKQDIVERNSVSFLYRPFPLLTRDQKEQLVSVIKGHIGAGRYQEAIASSERLLSLSLSGLDYYQNYYQRLLLTCVSALFLGCIAWLLWLLLPHRRSHYPLLSGGLLVNAACASLICISAALIYVQELPCQFFVYCLSPQLLWWGIARRREDFYLVMNSILQGQGALRFLCSCSVYVVGIEILVLSFYQRQVLSAGMMGLAAWLCATAHGSCWLKICWVISCAMLAVFPLLPVIARGSDPILLTCSGFLWFFAALFYLYWILTNSRYKDLHSVRVLWLQVTIIAASVWNIGSINSSIETKQGLLLFNQLLSWFLSGLSLFVPLRGAQRLTTRLVNVCLSLVVPFLLLSARYEGLFIFSLVVNLSLWLAVECGSSHLSPLELTCLTVDKSVEKSAWDNPPTSSDFRRAYFILFYIILSFFGTGNIASINSFDPTWVRCFVTVFSPFLMTSLILLKTVIPFLIVGCFMKTLDVITEAPMGRLFLVVLMFSDAMGLNFLHLVTNTGSWLDIGTSISHFVIMQATTLFLVLLYKVAHLLMTTRLPRLGTSYGPISRQTTHTGKKGV